MSPRQKLRRKVAVIQKMLENLDDIIPSPRYDRDTLRDEIVEIHRATLRLIELTNDIDL